MAQCVALREWTPGPLGEASEHLRKRLNKPLNHFKVCPHGPLIIKPRTQTHIAKHTLPYTRGPKRQIYVRPI